MLNKVLKISTNLLYKKELLGPDLTLLLIPDADVANLTTVEKQQMVFNVYQDLGWVESLVC